MLHSIIKIAVGALLHCLLANMASANDAPSAEVTPARIESALDKLEELANETLHGMGVPGIAIAVVHQDQVVYKKGFGVREAGKPDRIDADTVFQVASCPSRSRRPCWRRWWARDGSTGTIA